MFDFWLIISDFIELFLGGWRSIDTEDLIIQKHPVSHKTTTSCLRTEIQSKVVNVGSRDSTGAFRRVKHFRRYLQLFRRLLYSTSFIYSRTPKIIRGKQFCWQTLKSPQLNLSSQQEHMYIPGGFVWCDGLFYLVKWPQEKWACDFHDDALPLSFQLQVAETFF